MVNVGIFFGAITYYLNARGKLDKVESYYAKFAHFKKKYGFGVGEDAASSSSSNTPSTSIAPGTAENSHLASVTQSLEDKLMSREEVKESTSLECNDIDWCNISMPKHSYFKFAPPNDPVKWKRAQILAASGEQVFLQRIARVFKQPFDFLDGDRSFRRLHYIVDVFVDDKHGLEQITLKNEKTLTESDSQASSGDSESTSRRRRLTEYVERLEDMKNKNRLTALEEEEEKRRRRGIKDEEESTRRKLASKSSAVSETGIGRESGSNEVQPWEAEGRRVIPLPYNFRATGRAPILQMGYTAFHKDLNSYFSGNRVGGVFIKSHDFFRQWKRLKDEFDTPFITICSLNENWGIFSTMFPNRTAAWGQCCNREKDKIIYEFLNHDKTLMMVINQHSNISHPKLVTLPRGLPLTWEHTETMVWDSMRSTLKNVKKNKLLMAAASSWGKRPQMLRCISEKMSPEDFDGHVKTPKKEMDKTKSDRRRYYEKLASSRFGVSLPGLGYDTFRMWELLTMGTVVVIERGVGFDRTLWRLPALIVDDFDDINPTLLRTAYIEAVYRADDFEYERLTQSFWWSVLMNVSYTKSVQTILDYFPMEAEDNNFMRPRELFACGLTDTCGPGTKRIPKKSC